MDAARVAWTHALLNVSVAGFQEAYEVWFIRLQRCIGNKGAYLKITSVL